MSLVERLTAPLPDLEAAARVTAGFDRALRFGFTRLGADERAGLEQLAGAVDGSPLGPATADAVAALAEGQLLGHHLGVVAGARAAVEGARHDAVLEQAAAALGLGVVEPDLEPTPLPSPADLTLLDGARQWLIEVAAAGLGQLDPATVVPAIHGLRHLQEAPATRRLAAVLTGFAHELADAAPTAALPDPPTRRWADLWTTCLLATFSLPPVPTARTVDGVLRPLGADLRHHDHLVSVVVHGLLDTGDGGPDRLVRTTLSAWKVDAIGGEELWLPLRDLAPDLVDALAVPVELALTGATLLGTGDLLWDGAVTPGEPFEPWSVDLAGAVAVAPAPRDRHPLALALPLTRTGKGVVGADAVDGIPLDTAAVSPHANLDEATLAKATGLVGLLRFDDGFAVQPLAVKVGRKVRGPADGIAAAAKIKKPAYGVLRERSSKLLRKRA